MNYHEIRIGDKVQMIGQPATKGTVEKKVYAKTVVENGSHETTFEVSVKYDNARNVTYKVDPNKLELALVEPDYSPFNLHNESPTDFELRQNEIRKNYHKIRPGESWNEYESRTGLPAPEIRDREGLDYWADKVIKSIGECTINDFASKMTTRPNTNRSCLG